MMIGTIKNSYDFSLEQYVASEDRNCSFVVLDIGDELMVLPKISDERLMEIARELAQNVMNYRKGPKAGRNYITLDRVF